MSILRLQQARSGDALALGFSRKGGTPELLVLLCGRHGDLFRQAFANRTDTGTAGSIEALLGSTAAAGVAISLGRDAGRYGAALARWPLWLHVVEDAEGYLHGPPSPAARPLLTPDPLIAVHDLAGVLEDSSQHLQGPDLVQILGDDPGGVLHRRAKTFSGISALAEPLSAPAPPRFGVTATAVLVLQGLARRAVPRHIDALAAAIHRTVEPLEGIRTFVPSSDPVNLLGSGGQYGASLYLACGTALPGWEPPAAEHGTASPEIAANRREAGG